MPISLDRMRFRTRMGLGNLEEDDVGGDDESIDELLNISLWELENKFPFKEKECRTTFETVPGQDRYQLPTYFDSILSIGIRVAYDESTVIHKLKRSSAANYHDELFEPSDVNTVLNRGEPSSYYRRNNFLVLRDIPDAIYTVEMIHLKTIADLLEDAKEITGLPRAWDEIVVMGAIARGHFYSQDYNMARQAKNFQGDFIKTAVPTKAKETFDSRYTGVKPIDEYPNE